MELVGIAVIAFILVLFGVRGLVAIGKVIGYFVFFVVAYMVVIQPVINVISQTGLVGFIVVILFVFILGILIFAGFMYIIKFLTKLLKAGQ